MPHMGALNQKIKNTLIPRNTKESYPVIIDGNTSFRKQEHNIAETAILTAFIPLKKTGIFSMLTHIYSARGVKKRVDPYKANK